MMKRSTIVSLALLILGTALLLYWTIDSPEPEVSQDATAPTNRDKSAEQSQLQKTPPPAEKLRPLRRRPTKEEQRLTRADFEKSFPGNWSFREDQGRVKRVFGGKIVSGELSGESLQSLMNQWAPLFELPADSFLKPARSLHSKSDTPVQIFILDQFYQGYPVYGARVKISASSESREILGIDASESLPLRGTLPEQILRPEEIVNRTQNLGLSMQASRLTDLAVFSDSTGKARLAYLIKNTGSSRPTMYLVDAETGVLVKREDLFVLE